MCCSTIKKLLNYKFLNMTNQRITPEWIDSLKPNEVFVFGSNLAGMHGGGAAMVAHLKFGAVMGQGVGMQGQSYAIPTMHGGRHTPNWCSSLRLLVAVLQGLAWPKLRRCSPLPPR